MLAVLTVSISGFLGWVYWFVWHNWKENQKEIFLISPWVPDCRAIPCSVHIYALLRFLTGMGGIGCFMVCFVLVVEHVGFKVNVTAICKKGCTHEYDSSLHYWWSCYWSWSVIPLPQFTMLVGIAIEIPFAFGEAILGVEAIFIRYHLSLNKWKKRK